MAAGMFRFGRKRGSDFLQKYHIQSHEVVGEWPTRILQVHSKDHLTEIECEELPWI